MSEGPKPAKAILQRTVRLPGRVLQRVADSPLADSQGDESALYQHSVLCQTGLPYRDPGSAVRKWERLNGQVKLRVEAGVAYNGEDFVQVGLPFGPKPRLALFHLHAEALRTQSPQIELEDSLTAFVKRTLGLDSQGRNIKVVKEQLTRLAAADFRFGMVLEGRPVTLKSTVIEGFDLWTARDPRQRVLWPTTVQFSQRYFQSLMQHAVPLREEAVARLSHSAMALDVYAWLAQRLRRVPPQGASVSWEALHAQFGLDYTRVRDFRRVFMKVLHQVRAVYPESRFVAADAGMRLNNSPPPVPERLGLKAIRKGGRKARTVDKPVKS